MNPPDLLILSLATFYAAYAVSRTAGPFNVFATITAFCLSHKWLEGFGHLLKCFYCVAFWAGVVFYLVLQTQFAPVALPFAAAGVAAFMFRWTGGIHVE